MKPKAMGMLAVAVLVMGLTAALLETRTGTVSDDVLGTEVFPALSASLDEVGSVSIEKGATMVTSLSREGGVWLVDSKDGYPANFEMLADLLNGLANATYLERKTSNPENFPLLGVADDGIKVTVTQGEVSLSLVLGNESSGMEGIFALFPGEQQAWLISAVSRIATEPEAWLDKVVLDVAAEEVEKVRFVSTTGGTLVAIRDDETGDLAVQDVPPDQNLRYPTIGNSLARALVNVRIADVRRRTGLVWGDVGSAVFSLKNGGEIMVSVAPATEDGSRWIRFDATMDRADGLPRLDVDRLATFEFLVSETVAEQFGRTMDDMIEPPEQTAAE